MHSASASAFDPAGSPPPRIPSTSSASDCVGSFVPPPTVPTSRLASETETYSDPSSVTSAVVIAFAPSTTCASSWPVARNIDATTFATWALKPIDPAFADPSRFFRVLISAIAAGVVWSFDSTTSRGIFTSAVTERPRPSIALIAAGFLSEQTLPDSAMSEALVSASITSQAALVAIVAMFIPIASFVS